MRGITSFADFFLVCSGTNSKQNQAIADEIERELAVSGEKVLSSEGYTNAEWILMDYGDLVIHVMEPEKREYYDLERLWRQAKPVEIPPPAA